MKKSINKLFLVLFAVLYPVMSLIAQPGNPPDPLGNQGSPDGLSCPISDGTYIFLILAITYGIYKFYQLKKHNKTA